MGRELTRRLDHASSSLSGAAAEALDVGPGGSHVLGRADERQPEVVDSLLQADAQVTQVLVSEDGQTGQP
jgi:hypothetical protein